MQLHVFFFSLSLPSHLNHSNTFSKQWFYLFYYDFLFSISSPPLPVCYLGLLLVGKPPKLWANPLMSVSLLAALVLGKYLQHHLIWLGNGALMSLGGNRNRSTKPCRQRSRRCEAVIKDVCWFSNSVDTMCLAKIYIAFDIFHILSDCNLNVWGTLVGFNI